MAFAGKLRHVRQAGIMGSASTLAELCVTAIPCLVTEPGASEAPALIEVILSTARNGDNAVSEKDQGWEGE